MDFLDLSGFWELAKERPFLGWCLAWGFWIIASIIKIPFDLVYKCWKRYLRSKDIQAKGWPTAPLMDADGDIIHPKKEG